MDKHIKEGKERILKVLETIGTIHQGKEREI